MKKIILTYVLLNFATINAQNQSSKDNQSRFSIIPSYGYAWRTADTPSNISTELKNIINQLKKGSNFEIVGLYLVSNNFNNKSHFGFKYSRYSANATGNFYADGINIYSSTDDIISYFGPVYSLSSDYNTGELYCDLSLGYISYVSSTLYQAYNYEGRITEKFEGDNLGLSMNISYFFKINKYVKIGPNFNVTIGTLSDGYRTIDNIRSYEKFNDNEKESITRVSLNLQAKFNF